jgi:hypothetical protein
LTLKLYQELHIKVLFPDMETFVVQTLTKTSSFGCLKTLIAKRMGKTLKKIEDDCDIRLHDDPIQDRSKTATLEEIGLEHTCEIVVGLFRKD